MTLRVQLSESLLSWGAVLYCAKPEEGRLEVRLLGTFTIQHDVEPVVIVSRTGQSLFAFLILTRGTPHRREKLAGMFWPGTKCKALMAGGNKLCHACS